MTPSKLDRYLNILEILVRRPQKIDNIAYRAKMECNSLKRHLDFLIANGLIERRTMRNKRAVYSINERGISVFKTLRALKYLEKLRASLPIIEEAKEITPILSKHSRKRREE